MTYIHDQLDALIQTGIPLTGNTGKVRTLIELGHAPKTAWRAFPALYAQRYGRRLGFYDEPNAASEDKYRGAPPAKKSQEPMHLPKAKSHEDELAKLVRKAIDREKITVSRGAEILGLSMDEMQQRAQYWYKSP